MRLLAGAGVLVGLVYLTGAYQRRLESGAPMGSAIPVTVGMPRRALLTLQDAVAGVVDGDPLADLARGLAMVARRLTHADPGWGRAPTEGG